jgi:hypothetical protein
MAGGATIISLVVYVEKFGMELLSIFIYSSAPTTLLLQLFADERLGHRLQEDVDVTLLDHARSRIELLPRELEIDNV